MKRINKNIENKDLLVLEKLLDKCCTCKIKDMLIKIYRKKIMKYEKGSLEEVGIGLVLSDLEKLSICYKHKYNKQK